VQDADQREAEHVAVKTDGAMKIGNPQHDLADAERVDRVCRYGFRHFLPPSLAHARFLALRK
jgi:hypothetical protein